jgi:hypothetical protein
MEEGDIKMICDFCKNEMTKKKEKCICEGDGCSLCDKTGELTIVQCTNPNCEPPDYNLEPWDETE